MTGLHRSQGSDNHRFRASVRKRANNMKSPASDDGERLNGGGFKWRGFSELTGNEVEFAVVVSDQGAHSDLSRNRRIERFARFARQCIDTKGLANECRSFFQYTVMNYCIVGIAGHVEHFHIGTQRR